MIFITMLRLIFGFVRFQAEGGFSERFINLCSLSSIPLWRLKSDGSKIIACTTVKGYFQIRSCAVKSGMRLKILERHGFPFFLKKYRKRAGVLVGLAVFFSVIAILSSMIWTIEISGNETITQEEITAVLAQAGLKPGMLKSKLNAPEIRFYALGHLQNLSYLAVNMMGSCVQIEVTERIESPKLPVQDEPCDIISTMDGQIVTLEVYEGTKMYKIGEAVRTGSVLAGGFEELSDGSVRLRHAEAFAVIRAEVECEGQAEEGREIYIKSAEEKHITLHLLGLNLPLFIEGDTAPSYVRSAYLTVNGIRLPFGYTEEIFVTYEEKTSEPTESELALAAAESYFLKKAELFAGANITAEDISVNNNIISGKFTAEFSAGIASPMSFEQNLSILECKNFLFSEVCALDCKNLIFSEVCAMILA